MAATARRGGASIFDTTNKRGLQSLLTQTYGKPVELNFIKVHRAHHDADILASFVKQKLVDRKNQPRRVIRDAAWKAQLPSPTTLSKLKQERQHRRNSALPLTPDALTHAHPPPASRILQDLELSQVSSVQVQAGGRLSKRITANRAQSKVARRGASAKGEAHLVKGYQKASITRAQRAGKRRIGSYGIKVQLGHS